jgi:hypothetical protein
MPPGYDESPKYAADLGHEFIKSLHDLRSELRETRMEMSKLRKTMESHERSVNENTDMTNGLAQMLRAVIERFNVASGIGKLLGGFLNRRQQRD